MKTILENTPVEGNVLVKKINDLQDEVDAVAKVIVGGFGAKNSVSSRLRYALYTSSSAQVDITGAQKEQFEIANKDFESQISKFNNLYEVEIPKLEKEFEAAGGVLFNNPPTRRRFFEE